MTDRQKIMSDLEGLTFDDWHMFHCDSDVQGIAIDAMNLLKEQQETIELQGSLLTLAHAAMSHGKKEGLTNGAGPGRNREDPASHS